MRPEDTPIGLYLTRTARLVSRAFDDALAEAGGSLPVWLVLLNLKIQQDANQRQLAEAVGVSEATLTHHLNAMEKDGLLARRRDPSNRRNHIIELTAPGEAAFTRLAAAASPSTNDYAPTFNRRTSPRCVSCWISCPGTSAPARPGRRGQG